MNVKLLLPVFLVTLAFFARAEDSKPKYGVATSPKAETGWNTNPAYWERVLGQKRDAPELRIGKSGFVMSGPLLEGVRRQRSSGDRSVGKRLLGLPIVRLFVPGPMPSPPGGGQYLRWGESDRPWIAIAEGGAPGSSTSNPVTHEARTSLISIVR